MSRPEAVTEARALRISPAGLPLSVVLLAGAVALWLVSLRGVQPLRMTDFGLVSVLPWSFYVALALLTASFWIALRRERIDERLLLLHGVVLILVLHGTPEILYGTLRYSWAWKHLGVVDYIQTHGHVDPNLGVENVYQSWPGFFALAAFVAKTAGVSVLALAGWAPVFFELAFLLALLLLFRPFARDRRLMWLAIWIFLCANWVGQDYFSPQALNFFLYLVLLAVVLQWLRPADVPDRATVRRWLRNDGATERFRALVARGGAAMSPPVESGRRGAAIAFCALLCAVIASSHQLTPLMAVSALTALVVFQQCSVRWLPLLMAALTAGWAGWMAQPFLSRNLHWILKSVGTFGGNLQTTPTDLTRASHAAVQIAYVDRALTAGLIALALVGAIRRFRRGSVELVPVLLVISPALLIVVNAYGGEMLFRVYLFALPFLALLAAGALVPSGSSGVGRAATAGGLAVSALLLAGMLVAYYGKERTNYFAPDEVAAVRYVYAHAPRGSMVLDVTSNYPRQFAHLTDYDYESLTVAGVDPQLLHRPLTTIVDVMSTSRRGHAYLILTRSEAADIEMSGILPRGWLADVMRRARSSPRFRIVYSSPNAMVLRYVA